MSDCVLLRCIVDQSSYAGASRRSAPGPVLAGQRAHLRDAPGGAHRPPLDAAEKHVFPHRIIGPH
eukprot:7472325-Pyramimonas_sp.AAC.1